MQILLPRSRNLAPHSQAIITAGQTGIVLSSNLYPLPHVAGTGLKANGTSPFRSRLAGRCAWRVICHFVEQTLTRWIEMIRRIVTARARPARKAAHSSPEISAHGNRRRELAVRGPRQALSSHWMLHRRAPGQRTGVDLTSPFSSPCGTRDRVPRRCRARRR